MLIDRTEIERVLPGYEIGGQIGRGGFGLVFTARHRRLDTIRAVKVIATAEVDELELSRRFLAEAQMMTELDHPHLVRVFEYAEDGPLHLLVMEYLAGGTLTQRLRTTVHPREACAWGLALADALQAVHDRGVAHRDIKPDNVLFTAAGAPKLADFGIAKVMEGTAMPTSGLLGTPLYMAPEQFLGAPVGPRTDVYSLAATLYRTLSGRAPFGPDLSLAAIVRHQLEMPPAPLEDTPPAIAAVVVRALAKDPADRPASAHAFAVELARAAREDFGSGWIAAAGVPLRVAPELLLDEPTPPEPVTEVVQEPPTVAVGGARRSRRRLWQLVAAGVALVALVLTAGYAGALIADRGEVPVTAPRPASASPTPKVATIAKLVHTFTGHTDSVYGVVYDGAHNRLVSAGNDRSVRYWNLTTGAAAGPARPGQHESVLGLAASSDGRVLASGNGDHTVQLWDPDTGRPRGRPLTGHTDQVNSVAVTADGRRVASGGGDHTVRIWDPATRRPVGKPLVGHTKPVVWVAFSPDGTLLASAGADRTVRLWDVATGTQVGAPLLGHTDEVLTVAFSPDGKRLASGGRDTTVRLWDVETHQQIGAAINGHTTKVTTVAFSPDGSLLASAGGDVALGLWDPHTGAPISLVATDHRDTIFAMAFSPDGRQLATASADDTVKLWELT
ncbi:WD40 repeat domain-containing serine/threonine protein kinase [Cryptosporangium arvum]|uniref:WD40 repeat domain-containing serine/threonine protein kinase n=1 Tax=Cryptosporangium arvum TaxID=80871 RepID=UPI0004B5A961|nr:serine/threonine-protein kinase [Cryptosporangium arvum]